MSMRVEFVRAGAGSGKTYHLTQLLARALRTGTARPEAIVATTFTVKAATELRARARGELLAGGDLAMAAAIGQARIGTVNSVCGQLIQRFCFELGLSPEQSVLSEAQGRRLMRIAIDSVQGDSAELLRAARRLGLEDGRNPADQRIASDVHAIVDAARSNDIRPQALAEMGRRNADAMLASWPAPGVERTSELLAAIAVAEEGLQAVVDGGAKVPAVTVDGLQELRELRDAVAGGRFAWKDWHALSGISAGAKQRDLLAPVQQIALSHEQDPRFHADVRSYLEGVFALAAQSLEGFERAKKDLGVVDFADQEVLLLRALRESDLVREAIASELDLVLVDEFQDTNPLQLAIFVELAKLARQSVWVGDPKQAIYGFRGTDSRLIQQILGSIQSWGGTLAQPLTTSYRSTPQLVAVTNEVFGPAFAPAPPSEVRLEAARAVSAQPALLNWSFEKTRSVGEFQGLGRAITELLQQDVQVEDKASKSMRAAQAGDIAVLCRTKADIRAVVRALTRWGLPVSASRPGLLQTPEALLVLACLRRLHDPSDTVATALILGLADCQDPETWLDDRLAYLADTGVDAEGKPTHPRSAWKVQGGGAHPLLARLHQLRPRLLALTPREALRLGKAESGVAQLAHQWSGSAHEARLRLANVEALLELAASYEEECLGARQPASVNGLLLWLGTLESALLDERAPSTGGAVQVMTCHAAKGLEWPIVVVAGLDHVHRTDLWNVRARTQGEFQATAPLDNRFVHYWVYPYGRNGKVPVAQRAQDSAIGREMEAAAMDENKRLLYVTLTRARDVLVLTGAATAGKTPATDWLDSVAGTPTLWGESGSVPADVMACERRHLRWSLDQCTSAPPAGAPQQLSFYPAGTPRECLPLWFAPSAATGEGFRVAASESVGERIPVAPGVDMASLGSAVHACIALAVADSSLVFGDTDADEILQRWGVGDYVDGDRVSLQVQTFLRWIERRWPGARAWAELPVEAKRQDGTAVRGQIDLLLKTAAGWILFDHKADPRSVGDGDRLANAHGGQLQAYAEAIRIASSEAVCEQWLFLPVAGTAVRIEAGTAR